MHKCIKCFMLDLCNDTSNNTKINSPGVNYHGIPKSTLMRRKWLRVNGIDRFRDWQHICSNHFFEKNLGKNYNPEKKQVLFSNTIPQPYDGNGIRNLTYYDESDCIEFEFYREEHIGNIPSTSSSSNYVANVESNKTPISSDTTSCNVPSLFLDKNITNTKKIQSASTILKNWRSISNDVANVGPYNNIVIFLSSTKDVEFDCSVPQCKTNTEKDVENLCLYAPTMEHLKKWSDILGVHLTPTSLVCGRHFRSQDFQRATTLSIKNFYRILDPDALPVPMNYVPVLSRCEDTFISLIDDEVAEQSSEKKNSNVKDNTSMTIDLTIDDSSNSSLSITLEATT